MIVWVASATAATALSDAVNTNGSAVAVIVPLSLSPSRADVFARAASGFESRQQWTEARVAWREALRLQPEQDTYLVGLARVLTQESAFTDARAALQRAAQLNPQDPSHPRSLASVERLRTRTISGAERAAALAEADRQYARATALAPGLPALWIEWANVDAERRDFPSALDKLARAIGLDETRIDAWRLRGLIYALLQRPDDALADYDRALAIAPADVVALRGRAFALAELGRQDEALSAVSQVLAVAPADNAALGLRARLNAEPPR